MDPQLQAIGLGRLAPVTSKDATKTEGGAKQHQQQHSEIGPYQKQQGDSVSYQSVSSVGCSSSELLLMSSARLGSSGISCSDVLNTIKSSGMIDSVEDCRTQLLSDTGYSISVNSGRMSPCYSNSYATLTPLQPLPPISTVSERFGGLVSASNGGSFVFMQSGELGMAGYDGGDGDGEDGRDECSFSYKYQKDPEIDTTNNHINYDAMEPVSPVELLSRGASGSYGQLRGSPYASFNHTGMVKSEGVTMSAETHSPYSTYASNLMSVEALPMKSAAQTLAPMKNVSQTMAPMMQQMLNNHGASLHQHLQPHLHQSCLLSADAHQRQILAPPVTTMRHVNTSPIQDQPSSSTDSHEDSRQEMEEINTREIAQKVSNELKKYSIPQAVFAQRILGRSQGTLSDLLRNPKPWSKLKSGRETFRRMWKWLQDSECQRLAQLRMAGGVQSFTTSDATSNLSKQPMMACKRTREGLPSRPDSSGGGGGPPPPVPAAAATTKKPRMVFTEIQRRTLVAIFKEIKRPSKEIQATIAEQLGLKVSTVVNFFMNARRRSVDKYVEDLSDKDTVNNAVSSTANSMDDSTGQ